MVEVKFKKLHPEAEMPKKATDGSGAYDIKCLGSTLCKESYTDGHSTSYCVCSTGLAVQIPKGYIGILQSRSSVSERGLILCNGTGLIDSDYRGELTARFYEMSKGANCYTKGDRCIQFYIIPVPEIKFTEVRELDSTERGEGGYGSTGE